MNFDLTEEQQMLTDSVRKLVDDHYQLEDRMSYTKIKGGFKPELWQQMAELGWLGLTTPVEQGGFGGNQVDTMLLMEQFGRGLVCEPFFASVVLGLRALHLAGSASQKSALVEKMVSGEFQFALAYAEPQAGADLHDVTTRAMHNPDGFVLNGSKSMVANAATASHVIVSARTSGAQRDAQGISLFIVPTDTQGLTRSNFPTVDGLQASELKFDQVELPDDALLGAVDEGYEVLLQVALDGMLALCAEAVGAMEVLYKDTVAYTSEREQFDHPLVEFQVVKHRLVDMFMEYEQCKSLLYRATLEVAQNGTQAKRTVHALKHLVGETGVMIGENAVQLHGGMGMTEELRIGHYFKRLLVIDAQFGNSDYHLEQFAA